MTEPNRYGITRKAAASFEETLEKARAALQARGFGILWEIDVRETMKKKLDVDFPPYRILGACKPDIAHQALTAEPDIGLLLPCNCIVRQDGDEVVVGAIAPRSLLGLTGRDDLTPFADKIAGFLEGVVAEAAGAGGAAS